MNILIKKALVFISKGLYKIKVVCSKGLIVRNKNCVFFSKFKITGSLNITLDKGQVINSKIISRGKNNVILFEGEVKIYNCIFMINGDNCVIKIKGNRIIKNSKFELLDSNEVFIVGENTGFNRNRVVIAGVNNKVELGKECIFAEEAQIWASDTHSIIDINTNKRINKDQSIKIHNRVWVGNRVLIMKGVELQSDSIIAAGSIVTKNVNKNTLVGGIPAKELKKGVKWDIKRL